MNTLFHAIWRGVAGLISGLLMSSTVCAADIQMLVRV